MAHAISAKPTRARSYFEGDEESKARGLFQLLREDGTPADDTALANADRALARRLFEGMHSRSSSSE